MLFVYSTAIIGWICAVVKADYECLCNYHVERAIYPSMSIEDTPIGYLYEFDCKPTYKISTPNWQTIQYEKQVRLSFTFQLICNIRKRTFWHFRLPKTKISLRICAVWLVFVVRINKHGNLAYATKEDSDQTARMRRLIWIFAVRTYPMV